MLLATRFYEDPLALFCIGLGLLILFFWYFATEIERRKRNIGTGLVLGISALCILAMFPPKERFQGGIDLIGGSAFTLRVQERENEEGERTPVTQRQVEQAIEIIRSRLDSSGTSEAIIARLGSDQIIVQMPGVTPEQSDRIRTELEKVAALELREVHPRSDELAQRVLDGEEVVPGYRALPYTRTNDDGVDITTPILLSRRAALGGSDVARANPSMQRNDAVDIVLNNAGGDKMVALTRNMQPGVGRIAIVLDGVVISAPVVQSVPLGRNFQISGLREAGERESLARALENPLENPLEVEDFRSISPTLGEAIVKQGVWAALAGIIVTFIFVLLYYRIAGIVALTGLVVNGVILFGVMAMFQFTFSLPGIAGIILTIGMAVDANVLIYERLREELTAGKSFKNAISAAYDKAFSAIFDANITSLISAVILFWIASGTVKGFAVTLTVGILASMFSAILVTRVFFRWAVDLNLLRGLSFMDLIKSSSFDFLGKRRITAAISAVLFAASITGFLTHRDDALGIDFTGGTRIQFQLGEESIPPSEVDAVLSGLDLTRVAYPQEESNPATGTMLSIRSDSADAEKILTALRESFPLLGERVEMTAAEREAMERMDANLAEDEARLAADGMKWRYDASLEEVDALLGFTYLTESLIALGLGLIGILIYVTIRFEFSFAVGGMVAIIHDILITLGVVVLLGRELSMIHVGAILAVAGYSINDTIVIFDRIRENLFLRKGSTETIMNEAINATLSRTILTSATTIATVMILSIFGGSVLRDFSVMILVGLVVGTYSSIFVAAPVVLWFSSRKGGNLRKQVVQARLEVEQDPTELKGPAPEAR